MKFEALGFRQFWPTKKRIFSRGVPRRSQRRFSSAMAFGWVMDAESSA